MSTAISFEQFGLKPEVLTAVTELGYENPTPVQEASIPFLMEGNDLLSQAQTGTGKTAAFALPILSHIDLETKSPQALILAPTRELAIQVAEAFQSYAKHLDGFHVAPIYGGQDYQIQLRALKRGVQVIVGTPGRIMDHLRRKTISTDSLKTLVLDEADEMLNMGFIEDIEWILEQIPNEHQTALFSATMPKPILKIVDRYLKDAQKVKIQPTQNNIAAIEQFYLRVKGKQKLDALTRILEVEKTDATIIFARTKNSSADLAEKLQARGYGAAALNGDMNQALRKQVLDRLKSGSLDIIVATDVAARGIDVPRISHVINFDIPYDTEAYVHRIGRTGRAGRQGKAFLFITPREQRLLDDIAKTTGSNIQLIDAPSAQEMQEKRKEQFAEEVIQILENNKWLDKYHEMVSHIMEQGDYSIEEVAAALAHLNQRNNPLITHDIVTAEAEFSEGRQRRRQRSSRFNNRGGEGSHQQRKRRSHASDKGHKKHSGQPKEEANGNRKERRKFKDVDGNRKQQPRNDANGNRTSSGKKKKPGKKYRPVKPFTG
jgi:ATP-dependent RNA helicase DeaD